MTMEDEAKILLRIGDTSLLQPSGEVDERKYKYNLYCPYHQTSHPAYLKGDALYSRCVLGRRNRN